MFEKTPENEAEKKKIQGKVFIFVNALIANSLWFLVDAAMLRSFSRYSRYSFIFAPDQSLKQTASYFMDLFSTRKERYWLMACL